VAISGDGVPGLADKLMNLSAVVAVPTRSGLYCDYPAAHALGERALVALGVHISHLRSGRRDNPSARLLDALAELFDVPTGYLLDPSMDDRINAELNVLTALMGSRGKRLMLREQGVSPESIDHLEGLLQRIPQTEGMGERDQAR
jgi:transcriptional regulator with XRE-family HTH domain